MEKIERGVFDLDLFDKKTLVEILNKTHNRTLFGNLYDSGEYIGKDLINLRGFTHVVERVDIVGDKLEVFAKKAETSFSDEIFKCFNSFKVVPRFMSDGTFITFDIEPISGEKKININLTIC